MLLWLGYLFPSIYLLAYYGWHVVSQSSAFVRNNVNRAAGRTEIDELFSQAAV